MCLDRFAFFHQYGIKKYALLAKKLLVSGSVYYLLSVTDKEKVKRQTVEIEKRVYQITGKKLFSLKWALFKASPGLYRFAKRAYSKARGAPNR